MLVKWYSGVSVLVLASYSILVSMLCPSKVSLVALCYATWMAWPGTERGRMRILKTRGMSVPSGAKGQLIFIHIDS